MMVTWMLMNLGRWRPREATEQTHMEGRGVGREVQTPEYVGPGNVGRDSGRC